MLGEQVKDLAEYLRRSTIPQELSESREERDFQRWIAGRIGERLENRGGGELLMKAEALGGGVPALYMLGTSFWPDIAVGSESHPTLLAVEVKCLARKGLPGQIAQAVGQALIYRELYKQCLVVFIVLDDLDITFPAKLLNTLSENDIGVVQLGLR